MHFLLKKHSHTKLYRNGIERIKIKNKTKLRCPGYRVERLSDYPIIGFSQKHFIEKINIIQWNHISWCLGFSPSLNGFNHPFRYGPTHLKLSFLTAKCYQIVCIRRKLRKREFARILYSIDVLSFVRSIQQRNIVLNPALVEVVTWIVMLSYVKQEIILDYLLVVDGAYTI